MRKNLVSFLVLFQMFGAFSAPHHATAKPAKTAISEGNALQRSSFQEKIRPRTISEGMSIRAGELKIGAVWSKWVGNIVSLKDSPVFPLENEPTPTYGNYLFIKVYEENASGQVVECYHSHYWQLVDDKGAVFKHTSACFRGKYEADRELCDSSLLTEASRQMLPGQSKLWFLFFDVPDDRKYFLEVISDSARIHSYVELSPKKVAGKMTPASLVVDP